MNCIQCQQKTDNPRFCSRSCSAKFNNRGRPGKEIRQSQGFASVVLSHIVFEMVFMNQQGSVKHAKTIEILHVVKELWVNIVYLLVTRAVIRLGNMRLFVNVVEIGMPIYVNSRARTVVMTNTLNCVTSVLYQIFQMTPSFLR